MTEIRSFSNSVALADVHTGWQRTGNKPREHTRAETLPDVLGPSNKLILATIESNCGGDAVSKCRMSDMQDPSDQGKRLPCNYEDS